MSFWIMGDYVAVAAAVVAAVAVLMFIVFTLTEVLPPKLSFVVVVLVGWFCFKYC